MNKSPDEMNDKELLLYLIHCSKSHTEESRIIGNARSKDIVRVLINSLFKEISYEELQSISLDIIKIIDYDVYKECLEDDEMNEEVTDIMDYLIRTFDLTIKQ